MIKKRKPNILYWILVISEIIISAIAIYAVILIINSTEPVFSKPNLSNLLSIATWITVSIVVFLRIKFHGDDLYGMPGEGKNEANPDDGQDSLT